MTEDFPAIKVLDSCTKAKFATENSAIDFIQSKVKISKRRKMDFNSFSTYLCPQCLTWHITSQTINNNPSKNEKKIAYLKNVIKSREERINFHSHRADALIRENSILRQKLKDNPGNKRASKLSIENNDLEQRLSSQENLRQKILTANLDLYNLEKILIEKQAHIDELELKIGRQNKLLFSAALKRIHLKRAVLYS